MHTQDRAHLAAMARERALVVAQVRAVRGPHLDQFAAAHLHDLGHAERAADLHQLAARDQYLAALGERGQHEQDRGGTVVHHAGGFGTGEPREPALAAQAAVATLAVLEVVFERGVAGRHLGHGRARGRPQRGAAQVRVQYDAGGVQHPAQRGRGVGPGARRGAGREIDDVRRRARACALQRGARLGECFAHGAHYHGTRQRTRSLRERVMRQQLLDRRERTQRGGGHACEASRAARSAESAAAGLP
jgi:hypothetical protein